MIRFANCLNGIVNFLCLTFSFYKKKKNFCPYVLEQQINQQSVET